MTVHEFPTYPAARTRISDADRDRALARLREGAAEGRLSQDTFLRRMEFVLSAQARDQLDAVTSDLPKENRLARMILRAVARTSAFGVRLKMAWQTEKLQPIMLPAPGAYPVRIGRDPVNGLRLMEDTVSRNHAVLTCESGAWMLRDLGSTNGTFINGNRLTGAAPVSPGDQVGFGFARYRLTAR